MNYLWLDCETTGLDPNKNDVIQLACIPVINGVVHKSFNEFCQPLNWNAIDPGATAVHGITESKMRGFQTPDQMLQKFIEYAKSFNVKFTIGGYNVGFDKKFLSAMFNKNESTGEFFNIFTLDIKDTFLKAKKLKTKLGTTNIKLETLANHFDIKIKAHDALSDIEATIEVDEELSKMLGIKETVIDTSEISYSISKKFLEPAALHLHSMYGMVDSIPSIEEWRQWCKDNNVPGFGIVDHNNAASLYSMIRIDDVIGVPGTGLSYTTDDSDKFYPMNAWATSNEGYFNVMKLSSISHDRHIKETGSEIEVPVLTAHQILEHSNGVMFGLADHTNPIGCALLNESEEKAEEVLGNYITHFGRKNILVEFNPVNTYFEFDYKIGFKRYEGNPNKQYNEFMYRMVEKHNLKAIPVSAAMFIDKDDKILQDCVSKNASKGRHFHDTQSYHALLADDLYTGLKQHIPQLTEETFEKWISNTHDVINKAAEIDVEYDYHMPKIDIPDNVKAQTDNYDNQTFLFMMHKIKEYGRWVDTPEYKARFKKEVDVIMKNKELNFLPYFLLYADISEYARSIGILQNIARGSAGGSLLSYYLKIIHVNPIEADLPFERFLSHARINVKSFPDIDMDIGDNKRHLVITYLKDKYGLGFAQIGTHMTQKTKGAIKDTMLALYGKRRNDPEIEAVCRTIPDSPQGISEAKFLYGYVDKEGIRHDGELDTNEHLQNFFKQYPDVANLVGRLIGIIRNVGRHASAFVVATMDLSSTRVPLTKIQDGDSYLYVTQYEASQVENSGLVKADILGLSTLTAVTECIELASKSAGIDYLEEDSSGMRLIYRLPEDQGVYADFYSKKTDSSFQFNSELIKGYVQQFCPTERKHLKDMTAICRPGALDAPFEDTTAAQYYLDVRNGKRKLKFLHPDLIPILSMTNGIIVYQEQLMKILVDFCGYSLEDSDQIRNAIAKKKRHVMLEAFGKIRSGTKARGWSEEQSEILCHQIEAFAKYSFNLSHSHAYSELGYITMYLKHHHKLEWWTSVLNLHIGKEDKMRKDIALLGNLVSSPSIDAPSERFTIRRGKILAPISSVKGVGPKAVHEIVSKGPYENLTDFIKKVDHRRANIGVFAALIKARAADDFIHQIQERDGTTYSEARVELMREYRKIRGIKTEFKPEMFQLDALSTFLMERDTNKAFNKTMVDNPEIVEVLKQKWPEIRPTGNRHIPFMMGNVPIISSLKIAEGFVKNGHESTVGMIMLFESSSFRKGLSKKSGKPWSNCSIVLSDGYAQMECTQWDATGAMRLPKNTIMYVGGTLKEGWKTSTSITIKEMEYLDFKKELQNE